MISLHKLMVACVLTLGAAFAPADSALANHYSCPAGKHESYANNFSNPYWGLGYVTAYIPGLSACVGRIGKQETWADWAARNEACEGAYRYQGTGSYRNLTTSCSQSLSWNHAFGTCNWDDNVDHSGAAVGEVSCGTCPAGYQWNGNACVLGLSDRANNGDCPSCTGVGNPINSATGNKYQKEVDYRGPGPIPLEFVRSYNSHQNTAGGTVGSYWRSNYDRELIVKPFGKYGTNIFISEVRITAVLRDGRELKFSGSVDALTNWDIPIGTILNGPTYAAYTLERTATGFRLHTPEDLTEDYNHVGRLDVIRHRGGWTQSLTYEFTDDPDKYNDRLVSVEDSAGRTLNFSYDTSGRLATVTDPAQQVIAYGYDTSHRLTTATYPDGEVRTYVYGHAIAHLLTGILVNGQSFATFTYDSLGRGKTSEHGVGVGKVTVTYNANGSASILDALGATRGFTFSNVAGFLQRASVSQGSTGSTATYDLNGFADARTDFNGNVTDYSYNSRGLEESRTEASNDPNVARTVSTQWHAAFRLPTQVDEPGRRTTHTYDGSGNRLTETVTDTATSESRTTTWTYNSLGQVLSVDGPRTDVSDVTTYTYYECTTGAECGQLHTITNALGHVTTFASHDAHGNPLTIVDPNGVTTTLTYDLRRRLKTRTVGGATTTFDYDAAGLLDKATLPDGSFLQYTYDAAHRLTDIEDNAGNRIHYTLDAQGNRTQEEVLDPAGVLKRKQSQVFNVLGRLHQVKNAEDEVVTEFAYDDQGNRTSQTDAGAFQTIFTPDALNRTRQMTDAASGVTSFGYDALDQLTSVTDPKGLITSYALNALGDLKQQVSPDTGTTSYTYDAGSNRKTQTDARGVAAEYSYDPLNRLTFVDYPGTAEDVTYTYDSTSQPYGKGRLTGIQDAASAMSLTYDARGNVTEERRVIGGTTYVTGYGYDLADRLTSVTYPTGRLVTYERNALGQVARVTTTVNNATTPLADNITYVPFGGIASYTLGNGIVVTRTHDQDYRLSEIRDQGNNLIARRELFYDLRGNIESILDRADSSFSQSFSYDALSRLASADGAYGAQAFTYDGVGNRLTETATPPGGGAATQITYTYPTGSHRLSSLSDGTIFDYDASGNATQRGGLALSYNAANRLSSANSADGVSVDHVYSPSGQRIKKSSGGVTTVFHHDRQGRLLGEHFDGGSVDEREYIWLEDIPLAQAIVRTIPAPIVDNGSSGFSTTGAWSVASRPGQYGADHLVRAPAVEIPGEKALDNLDEGTSFAGVWTVGTDYIPIDEYCRKQQDILPPPSCPPGGDGCPDSCVLRAALDGAGLVQNGEAPYNGTYHKSVTTTSDQLAPEFTWSIPLSGTAGRYRVYARWVAVEGSGGVNYRIHHRAGQTVRAVDQTAYGEMWNFLGSFEFDAEAVVSLSPQPGVVAVADAIMVVPLEDIAGFRARWAAPVEAGAYDVYARWPAADGVSTSAPFSISSVTGVASLTQNQTANGGLWNLLGAFTFDDSEIHGVSLGALWDESVLADAIHFVPQVSRRYHLAYLHVDHLNTPHKMTDASQTVVWQGSYEPFGKGPITSLPHYDNPLRFPGQYFDAETALHQNWYRDYDPSIGRYLQSDPIGLRGGLNTYGYAFANPTRYVDPDGKLPVLVGAGIWWAACSLTAGHIAKVTFPDPSEDKKRHCYASCLLNKCMLWTYLPAVGSGSAFEYSPWGGGGGGPDPGDIDANIYGILSSYKGDCLEECNQCPIK